MESGTPAWVLIVLGMFTLTATLGSAWITTARVNRKVETRTDEVKADVAALDRSTQQVHEQVRTSNGRTLAQIAEDTVEDMDELRGDVMELAIQFARHIGDEHTHEMVRRHRQERRDREETVRTLREMEAGDARAERRRNADRRSSDLWEDE